MKIVFHLLVCLVGIACLPGWIHGLLGDPKSSSALRSIEHVSHQDISSQSQQLAVDATISQDFVVQNISFLPADSLTLNYRATQNLTITIHHNYTTSSASEYILVRLSLSDPRLLDGLPASGIVRSAGDSPLELTVYNLTGARIGRARLTVTVLAGNESTSPVGEVDTGGYEVKVMRPGASRMTVVGLLCILAGMATNVFAFGCGLTMDDIKFNLRHPAAIICNVVNQFILMPVVSDDFLCLVITIEHGP